MLLSNRLQAIADYVPLNSIVGDIGTDHGYIPSYLIEKGIAKKVIATDLSGSSLNKAQEFITEQEVKRSIDLRLGNGLDIIKPFEIDTVIISGMGGLLIKDILDRDKKKRDSITNFILQANIATKELTKYLYDNCFEIIDEKLVKDNKKIYEVIYAKKGKACIRNPIHYEIGVKLIANKDPLLGEFLENQIRVLQGILKGLEDKMTQKSIKRRMELEKWVEELKEVLIQFEGDKDNKYPE